MSPAGKSLTRPLLTGGGGGGCKGRDGG
ncbi:hypothetical protein L195_g062725 [Trifolium pratense]|uniref:Uncharacterized protein n=1 Tax=Trifolium pratense TaxID=57577 RepID=A0A2K3KHD4_TRIPR|nr:hypothetical protein L195_g062725 [Trifolium pratense]